MEARVLHMSEAATIGIHAVCRLAQKGGATSAGELAQILGASSHHLSKVMRKLVLAGVVSVAKGPNGGFYFEREQLELSLMEVFVAIEGSFNCSGCIFENGKCDRKKCIFEGVLKAANEAFEKYLKKTKIKKFTNR